MHWNSVGEFLAMGGYAGYVWWSFGITALCMVLEPWLARRQLRATQQRLSRQLRADAQTNRRSEAP